MEFGNAARWLHASRVNFDVANHANRPRLQWFWATWQRPVKESRRKGLRQGVTNARQQAWARALFTTRQSSSPAVAKASGLSSSSPSCCACPSVSDFLFTRKSGGLLPKCGAACDDEATAQRATLLPSFTRCYAMVRLRTPGSPAAAGLTTAEDPLAAVFGGLDLAASCRSGLALWPVRAA